MGLPAEVESDLDNDLGQKLAGALGAQHAMHGLFGNVFLRLGGEDFIYEWARDNPGRFITLLTKMTPGLMPTAGHQGDVHLHVHQTLVPTDLDSEVIDGD
jgi:hypothetical protein